MNELEAEVRKTAAFFLEQGRLLRTSFRESRLAPTVAVLVPSLAALAESVYQLSGFGTHALDPRPHLGDGLVAAGVVVAAVAAGAALGNLAWQLTTAPRNRSTSEGAPEAGTVPDTGHSS
ncbi:hypothetical protein ACF1AY_38780 [Streptomyces sp. NPDC014776]|uniref:hypothetical protein n=1 Tax=unclassified Streptomyces TaxID=2593676 RepID=UPI0036F56612